MKNILIFAVLSAVILTGCGNISPPFKAEQTTVTTDNPHTGVSPDNGICIYLMIGSVMLLSLIFASRKNNERNDV